MRTRARSAAPRADIVPLDRTSQISRPPDSTALPPLRSNNDGPIGPFVELSNPRRMPTLMPTGARELEPLTVRSLLRGLSRATRQGSQSEDVRGLRRPSARTAASRGDAWPNNMPVNVRSYTRRDGVCLYTEARTIEAKLPRDFRTAVSIERRSVESRNSADISDSTWFLGTTTA